MPGTRDREASVGRDISSGQFKPKGQSGGELLSLAVGPNSTEEGLLWGVLTRAAPTGARILKELMRYGSQSV